MNTTVRRKNLRKNLSFHEKDYKYIRQSAKKLKMRMAPFILMAIAYQNLKDK